MLRANPYGRGNFLVADRERDGIRRLRRVMQPGGDVEYEVAARFQRAVDEGQHGVAVGAATHLAEQVATLRHVSLVGLMTIAPMGAGGEETRAVFARLRELRDELEQRIGSALPELSMGMSADAEAAAAEGATLVRIGTLLFGPRG